MAFAQLRDSVTLNGVTIGNAEERGLFAASAIDGRPLDKSEKLLIIFASDARNTDMRFRDDAETIVEDWGNCRSHCYAIASMSVWQGRPYPGRCRRSGWTAGFMKRLPPVRGGQIPAG